MKTALCGMDISQLREYLTGIGEKPFRAEQIAEWIKRGRRIDEMTNLSKSLREKLESECTAIPVAIHSVYASEVDETRKLLYILDDDNMVEGVLMQHHYGSTLCLSTQVGCRMGCKFCASTLEGRIRDLTSAEMLGEVLCANRLLEDENKPRLSNLVLMGSGEPLDNYDNTVAFLRSVHTVLGISYRSISLSTCGIVPGIDRLLAEELPVTLSVSLHAPNDEIRRRTMPIANAYPIGSLIDACRRYVQATGRRVIFEYTLIHGVNDRREHADELASRLRGLQCHVNLIPLNAVPERELLCAADENIRAFASQLEKRHISVTVRKSMGSDIDGACGQLRRHVLKGDDK